MRRLWPAPSHRCSPRPQARRPTRRPSRRTRSPTPLSLELVYRSQVTTGATPEHLSVSTGPGPAFPGGGYFKRLGEMTLEGPGTVVRSTRSELIADRFCQPVFPDTHGNYSYSVPRIEVDPPANSTSATALPARPSDRLPGGAWPWRSSSGSAPGRRPLSPSARQARSTPARMGCRSASARIRPASPEPAFPLASAVRRPTVTAGDDVLVSGVTDPAIAGQLMTIRAARSGEGGPGDLANVPMGSAADDGDA